MTISNPKKSVLKSAESIFESMMGGGNGPDPIREVRVDGTPTVSKAPDVKNVHVPSEFITAICENSFGKCSDLKDVLEETEEVNEEVVNQDSSLTGKVESLITRLANLIREAKGVIEEMTTAGMIGTNQKSVLKTKKVDKNGFIAKSNKGNKGNCR